MTWTVYVRHNPTLDRVLQLDDYKKLDLSPRLNDVGRWILDVDRRAPGALQLSDPAYGIEVVRDGATVFSGPWDSSDHSRTDATSTLTVSGPDDTVWLKRRLAHPTPTDSAPPYDGQEYDVRTGVCSTVLRAYVDVNAGPTAVGPRQVPNLTVGGDPVAGSSVTGRARFQVLLTLLQELATAGGIGFDVVGTGGQLVFRTFALVDRTETAKFGIEFGNLLSYSYSRKAPAANYVTIGGGGEGTLRVFQEGDDGQSVVDWGRIEAFVDRRDTTDPAELGQTITENLDTSGEQTSLTIEPVDTPTLSFGAHYGLGDRVSVVVDGAVIQDSIREVKITLADGKQVVQPQIGTPGRTAVLALINAYQNTQQRLLNLERR